jgi:hypothetical protein
MRAVSIRVIKIKSGQHTLREGRSRNPLGPLGRIMSGCDERTKERPALQTESLMLRRPDARDIGSIMAIVGVWRWSVTSRRDVRVKKEIEARLADAQSLSHGQKRASRRCTARRSCSVFATGD